MPGFETVWVSSLTIFVSINIVSTPPIYMSLTEVTVDSNRPKLVRSALILAGAVACLMTLVGTDLLRLMGVMISDLRVAGGLVL